MLVLIIVINAVDLGKSWVISLPGGIQGEQLYSLLQHGLEAQSEREWNLSCRENSTERNMLHFPLKKGDLCACHTLH